MKPKSFPLALLQYLYPGTSDEFWFRRARDGRLGTLTAEPGKVRNRMVESAHVERSHGAITEEQFSAAVRRYEEDRRLVRRIAS